jgi:hypothetical protein
LKTRNNSLYTQHLKQTSNTAIISSLTALSGNAWSPQTCPGGLGSLRTRVILKDVNSMNSWPASNTLHITELPDLTRDLSLSIQRWAWNERLRQACAPCGHPARDIHQRSPLSTDSCPSTTFEACELECITSLGAEVHSVHAAQPNSVPRNSLDQRFSLYNEKNSLNLHCTSDSTP